MATTRRIPLRRCNGCGEMKPKKELIRVIHTPEDTIELDLTGKKNGRGAYVCKSEECLRLAMRSHALERSLSVTIPEDIYERLRKEIADA
ncbi:MAG: YlxR family protein [Lachnospiraceae bacterium]|nr:YlxR family protein [Lachnospiraceae bacterium]